MDRWTDGWVGGWMSEWAHENLGLDRLPAHRARLSPHHCLFSELSPAYRPFLHGLREECDHTTQRQSPGPRVLTLGSSWRCWTCSRANSAWGQREAEAHSCLLPGLVPPALPTWSSCARCFSLPGHAHPTLRTGHCWAPVETCHTGPLQGRTSGPASAPEPLCLRSNLRGWGHPEKSKDGGILRACIIFDSFLYLILLPPPSPHSCDPYKHLTPQTLSGLRFQRTWTEQFTPLCWGPPGPPCSAPHASAKALLAGSRVQRDRYRVLRRSGPSLCCASPLAILTPLHQPDSLPGSLRLCTFTAPSISLCESFYGSHMARVAHPGTLRDQTSSLGQSCSLQRQVLGESFLQCWMETWVRRLNSASFKQFAKYGLACISWVQRKRLFHK